MPLVDAHVQPLCLVLKQQVIAACTRLVAKMRNVYVNPLVGKTYGYTYGQQVIPESTVVGLSATAYVFPS